MERLSLLIISVTLLIFSIQNNNDHPAQTDFTSQDTQTAFATIYIYRNDTGAATFDWGIKTLPVSFGVQTKGKIKLRKIAELRNRQYFLMRLPAGTYYFDTREMPGRSEIEVEAGKTYFLCLERGTGCPTKEPGDPIPLNCEEISNSIYTVSTETGLKAIRRFIPIYEKDIKDRKLVIIPTERPSNIHCTGARATGVVVV